MISKFLKNELPFLLALITLIILSIAGNSSALRNSFITEVFLFIIIFAVIIYAAMGVVHHAEKLAHKFGEPYGTMILTLSAVTVEIIMIAAMMMHGDSDPAVARDTIFSTLMILLNGITGLIMLIGGMKYGEQKYNIRSANSFFSMIFGVTGIGLFLPMVVNQDKFVFYETFLIIACLALYIFFLRMQSKEHNYYFKFTGDKRPNDKILIRYQIELRSARCIILLCLLQQSQQFQFLPKAFQYMSMTVSGIFTFPPVLRALS